VATRPAKRDSICIDFEQDPFVMCRLLLVHSAKPFNPVPHLTAFAELSKNTKEYQGHGWGCAVLDKGEWKMHKNIRPVWEDDLRRFSETTRLLAHARSAFRDEGIAVENNMPFTDGGTIFIFNGELQGVRIKSEGRIGAEKIYNLIRRFDTGDTLSALKKAVRVIENRTRYVKAMNIIVSDERQAWTSSLFNEDPEYFTLHRKSGNGIEIVCSEPYPSSNGWHKIENRFTGVV
jgi:predicted glutamine amidotransferase